MNYRKFEITAVATTGLLKFLMVDYLNARFWFILLIGIFWISYFVFRISRHPEVLGQWGLGLAGFRSTLKVLLLPALLVVSGFVWYGLAAGTLVFNWHILPVMLLYPIWGTVQQLLVISLFGGNLCSTENAGMGKYSTITLTSFLFSVVHYPEYELMAATLVLAVVYCFIFFRFRNILILGIFHGWLACFFYFFVLGQDPWLELLGTI